MAFMNRPTPPMRPLRSSDPLLEPLDPVDQQNETCESGGFDSDFKILQHVVTPPSQEARSSGSLELNRPIFTKIVGVTMPDEKENRSPDKKDNTPPLRQKALAMISVKGAEAFSGPNPDYSLVIRPDWTNAYDSDALGVWLVETCSNLSVRLGFIANGERLCPECGKAYEKPRRSTEAIKECVECGSATVRAGLASRISNHLRRQGVTAEAPEETDDVVKIEIDFEHGGLTGGTGGAYRGCNVRITASESNSTL